MLEVRESVVVFSPDHGTEAHAMARDGSLGLVAFMPVVTRFAEWIVADDAYEFVETRADAYASDSATLDLAVQVVASEEHAHRTTGPLRLTYRGTLGEHRPKTAPRVNGRRIDDADVAVGDEIAIACTHRFRVDGG
jgi:hypothetical protein